ncbi:hypothetical protein ANO14919_099080 [Xylariales sp. No.14919]|nr:hypothetical protein ANO14919_099080 [Xylariales sp. No.14919]
MAFGLFAFIATIVKATALEGEHAQDLAYGIFWITITLYIQADLVIAAACAPAILKLWLSTFGIHEAPAAVFPLDQHGKPIPESQAELERDQPVLSEREWSTSDSRDELV